ncbi:hypothetical protein FPQ18DRAFT_306460 [Pyronema domesticum]|nr:hypothetical protein FPQ18DRAFT_306460 [Pyronema domesticum]
MPRDHNLNIPDKSYFSDSDSDEKSGKPTIPRRYTGADPEMKLLKRGLDSNDYSEKTCPYVLWKPFDFLTENLDLLKKHLTVLQQSKDHENQNTQNTSTGTVKYTSAVNSSGIPIYDDESSATAVKKILDSEPNGTSGESRDLVHENDETQVIKDFEYTIGFIENTLMESYIQHKEAFLVSPVNHEVTFTSLRFLFQAEIANSSGGGRRSGTITGNSTEPRSSYTPFMLNLVQFDYDASSNV